MAVTEQDRYLPLHGVALRARIRALIAAVRAAKEAAERSNQDAAYSSLDGAENDLVEALSRVLP